MAAGIDQSYIYLFFVVCFASMYSSLAYQFIVGGRDGWVINPSEKYDRWAQRMRFQVNDTLLFKYKNGSDSVLLVNKDDYAECRTENPTLKFEDGNSVFTLNRSGPFYFISGAQSNCVNGQKLITVVMAVRGRPSPPRSTAASPAAAPPNESSTSSPPPPTQAEAPAPEAAPRPSNSTPGSDTPADGGAAGHPHHRSFAPPACGAPTFVVVSTVSLAMSACLGGFINSV